MAQAAKKIIDPRCKDDCNKPSDTCCKAALANP